MLSAVFTGAGQLLSLEERPVPRPGPGQALIRVCRCGICASDISMTSGSAFDWPVGTALGHEYAGEIVEIGGDGDLKIGDRVTAVPMASCGHCAACLDDRPIHCAQVQSMAGGYGQYTLIALRGAIRLPEGLSFADGALVEPLASALRGVRRLNLPPNARIAVIGAGAIGAAAIYWLRQRAPASKIIALGRSRKHAGLAAAMGADAFLTSDAQLPENLNAALGGAPDVVLECAGKPGILQQALELVRPAGTILSLGGCVVPEQIQSVTAMWKDANMIFSIAYGQADFHAAVDALDAGNIQPRAMIEAVIPLGELPAKFEAIRQGAGLGKTQVDPFA